ncbi:hypothetical protein RB653_001692 [Dictyostelium firmibasis]|uniref:IPT/TIG domain-containing protein n=1 Tax=Dictyostelium firmibasis TaxID=79012 RepID=A0AAN7U8S8_9MYCE
MKNKVIVLFIFILFLSLVYSISPIGLEAHKDSLVIKYNADDYYYKNLTFDHDDGSGTYSMSFDCILNNTIRICTLPVNETDYPKMYAFKLYSCVFRNEKFYWCNYRVDVTRFPGPLLISDFRPPTRGGNVTLSGLEAHKDSLVIKYNADDYYYKNLTFDHDDGSGTHFMSFDCILNNTIRICTLPVKETDYPKMYSFHLFACVYRYEKLFMCDYKVDTSQLPGPFLISDFRPPTRGGNVTLSGYYLQLEIIGDIYFYNPYINDQYINSRDSYWVQGNIFSPKFDRINLSLLVHPGCGYRTILWDNRQDFNITYQDPFIKHIEINQEIIDISGTNFYNQSIFVSVIIENKRVDPKDIILVDFENIKLKYNYYEPFSKILSVQVSCCDYLSNKFEISYPPIPSTSNSIPKLKGGLLIINGNRLTSSPSSLNNNMSVIVGDSICSNISSTSTEIKCYLQPSNSTLNNLPIIVSINGFSNTNKLLLEYDIPSIISYSQVNEEIQIIGYCFGNINSSGIQINGKQVSNQIISINYDETILKLKVPNQNYNFNISIKSNSIKSNEINVNVNLFARINELPSIGNKLINFTLFYVNSSNINSIPTIKILNQQFNQSIKSISTKINETITCSFEIEYYCGVINYEIQIGNQRYQSSFSYEPPLINQCNLNSSEIVTCIGSGFSSGINKTTTIIISNQTIITTTNEQNKYNQSISFKFNEQYDINDELYLNVCGLLSNKVKINTIPIIKNVSIPNLFSTNGGDINIVTKYMNNNTNITIQCDNYSGGEETIKKECKIINSSLISCNIEWDGPIDKTCKVYFNNDIKTVSTFNVSYKSPSINRTSVIYPKQGGILTIIGNDFYNPIDMVTIGDLLKCNDPKFINHTMITCLILPTNNTSNIKYDESIYINVTINGKSGASKIFKYSSQPDEIHQYSAARNIFQNLLLSILIIVIISLLFTTTL